MEQTWGTWTASWCWSLLLFAVTIAIHAGGVVGIKRGLEHIRAFLASARRPFLDSTPGAITIIVVVALLLGILHAFEALIWAWVYVLLGAIPSPADAALYSVDSFTTRGASGLDLSREWRMMGAVEAGDGMLLFGISTAFLFYVMRSNWNVLVRMD
jgi:hypothetical protein